MQIVEQEKVRIQLTDECIEGEKFEKFLKFLLGQSDEIVGCRLYCKGLEESEAIKHTYKVKRYETTNKTHCTMGPLTEVYYFSNEEALRSALYKMEHIYAEIRLDENALYHLEDPAFYQDGELICSICSHEKMGYLELSLQQYETFRLLCVPHDIYQDDTLSLAQWIEECAFQERKKLTIFGKHEERIPENIGDLTHLKKLEIFDYEVRYLPQTLEKLANLECLRITGNQVDNLNFDIGQLKNLRILDFSSMPLKTFPENITKLTQLEELYLGGLQVSHIPETLMNLERLSVLTLPHIEEKDYSSEFMEFVEKLKPKAIGVSLRDILGEEVWSEIEKSNTGMIIEGNRFI
ncbi:MAG: leucine-rich repeat domain-containing protein [Cellulosilyticum sp.]|nr:leucine-rich repeat domain-containing protein [Cellulosilyticum sp.]